MATTYSNDIYANFAELKANQRYDLDYHIQFGQRPSNILFMAVHGGGIETGTTELVLYLAGTEYSYYLFEGFKSSGNGDLHITSTNFDEPTALRLVRDSDYIFSIHGYSDPNYKNTQIGGLDQELKEEVYRSLKEAGYNAEILPYGAPISGSEQSNFTNRTRRGKGVQLELSTAQRNAFFDTNTRAERRNTMNDELFGYARAIRKVIPN